MLEARVEKKRVCRFGHVKRAGDSEEDEIQIVRFSHERISSER